eukprot:Gb_13430 [translate_table: standard]
MQTRLFLWNQGTLFGIFVGGVSKKKSGLAIYQTPLKVHLWCLGLLVVRVFSFVSPFRHSLLPKVRRPHPVIDFTLLSMGNKNCCFSCCSSSIPQSDPMEPILKIPDDASSDINLDDLISHITQLLDAIKNASEKNQSHWQWPTSSAFSKLREFLEKRSDFISKKKGFLSKLSREAKTVAISILKEIGEAHWPAAGLVVVHSILERFESISVDKAECLQPLKAMNKLALHIKQLKDRANLREGMRNMIQESVCMIVEGSLLCCNQMQSSIFFNCRKTAVPRQKAYPEHAVGIEEQFYKGIQILELESEINAVAVILHGFGGMGKTTLAGAVFARLDIEGYKFSTVRLFENAERIPDIEKLQKWILKDLTGDEKDIRRLEDGQQLLRDILAEEQAFIYIDNVLKKDQLEKLLPKKLHNSKKLRLLLTARNDGANVNEIASDEMQLKIVEICKGIPLMLDIVGGYIFSSQNKDEAYRKIIEWHEKGSELSVEKEDSLEADGLNFAFEELPEWLKDPFHDICSFFTSWDWDEVACIVGENELYSLKKRALLRKEESNNRVNVHDIILRLGLNQTKGKRFTTVDGLREALEDNKDIHGIKGISLKYDESTKPFHIPAAQLDSMHDSLRILALGGMTAVDGKLFCLQMPPKLRIVDLEAKSVYGSSPLPLENHWIWKMFDKILSKLTSPFFNDEWSLIDCHDKPFCASTLRSNTILLFVVDRRDTSYPSSWPMEDVFHEQITSDHNIQIIYIGQYFSEMPVILKDRTLAYASHNSRACLFFDKALSILGVGDYSWEHHYFITTKVEEDKEGRKYFSSWEDLSKTNSLRKFVLSKSETYLRLKYLVEPSSVEVQESNIKLLRALLETDSEEKDFLLVKHNTDQKVNVEDLQEKLVLLYIAGCRGHLDSFMIEMTEMYVEFHEKYGYEIVSIPGIHYPDWSDFQEIVKNVPWLLMSNPWLMKSATKCFIEDEWQFLNKPILVVVEPDGRISNKNALPMVKRFGAEAYPFTQELKAAEWDQFEDMSSLEFLFQTLEFLQTAQESMKEGKMICFYGCYDDTLE